MRKVFENVRKFLYCNGVHLSWAFLLTTFAGCGETQVEPEHRDLVLRMATATSTQDPANLKIVEEEVGRMTAAAEMSQAQSRAFMAIVEMAKSGDWESARDRAYALRDGQKPTAQDLEAVANRKLPEMIRPDRIPKSRKNSG
ncbi:hypothetical protein GC170_05285 [bacterium]|nr:hypothetical protein [bacterium]